MRSLALTASALAAGFLVVPVPELHAQDPAPAVAAAVLPLPEPLRPGATVVRLSRDGQVDTLRTGSNPMVCFADNPSDTLLDVRCYHSTFVPMIYAARRLGPSTRNADAMDGRIRAEIAAGRLVVPPSPTAGYRVLGPLRGYDPATGTLSSAMDRWQSIHAPFATLASMGVGDVPHGIEPYMMASGTWWAHVMIMQAPLRY